MNHIGIGRIEDEKRRRVLEGATKVFLAYGYNRTTMDDIARAAEMSRPALYLLFRNKSDIYRVLASGFFEESMALTREALGGGGAFAERMNAMVDKSMIALIETIMASPHGAEILGAKDSLAADLAKDWCTRISETVAEAIDTEADQRGVDLAGRGLSAQTLADLFCDAMEGMKSRIDDIPAMRARAHTLVRLIERALAA